MTRGLVQKSTKSAKVISMSSAIALSREEVHEEIAEHYKRLSNLHVRLAVLSDPAAGLPLSALSGPSSTGRRKSPAKAGDSEDESVRIWSRFGSKKSLTKLGPRPIMFAQDGAGL
ncbi:MAG: hypothetical protein Q9166_002168 [cf. Caloplaca sp. 2 TL-2023]